MSALDVERGSRLAAHIQKPSGDAVPMKPTPSYCWTFARLRRSAGIPKQEYVGRVLSDLDVA